MKKGAFVPWETPGEGGGQVFCPAAPAAAGRGLGDRAGPFAEREVGPRETLPGGPFVRVGQDCLVWGEEPELGVGEHGRREGTGGDGGSREEAGRGDGRQSEGRRERPGPRGTAGPERGWAARTGGTERDTGSGAGWPDAAWTPPPATSASVTCPLSTPCPRPRPVVGISLCVHTCAARPSPAALIGAAAP